MIRAARWCGYGAAVCVVLLVLLAGCTDPPPQLKYPGFVVHITIDPALPELGLTTMAPGICKITLREYPTCLLHEIRHCTEGNWHAGRETDKDCF